MTEESRNLGELLFERYFEERGYEQLANERNFGSGKRPDSLLRAGIHEIVAEVKSFEPRPIAMPPTPGGMARTDLDTVRNTIKKAAGQLKGIQGYPLVIVLTNPMNAFVGLAPSDVIQAMYGNFEYTFTADGQQQWRTGGHGRLRVNEPDGTIRGFHEHVSAIAIVQEVHAEDASITRWLQQHSDEYPNLIEAVARAFDQPGSAQGSIVRADVFETVSETARPLPRDIFNGPYDTRWGIVGEGAYGQIGAQSGRS